MDIKLSIICIIETIIAFLVSFFAIWFIYFKWLRFLAIFLLFIHPFSLYAASYDTIANVTGKTGAQPEMQISSRIKRAYWVTITGTASIDIEMASRPNDQFVKLITGITSSSMVDTTAPGTRTRVNVISCSACTVLVVMEQE